MKKILITGASGFIGRHLYQRLKKMGYDITGVSFEGGKIDQDEITALDITDQEAVEIFFNRRVFDTVFHLAAYLPSKSEEEYYNVRKGFLINGLGTYNLLMASRKQGVSKFIYSSSASVFNRLSHKISVKEKEIACCENVYGITKLAGENLCEFFRKKYGLKTVCLRYASVYGPGEKNQGVIQFFLKRALAGETLEVFLGGERTQDFIYVKDAAEANFRAALSQAEGVYNIGSGEETAVIDLARLIIKVCRSKSKIVKAPFLKEDKSRFFLDIARAKKDLNFFPGYSLAQGLKEYKNYLCKK
ncbi:hypothetical protein COT20_01810 [bacterium (Candidatus Gribaldobacteria) CG08_land_8_20_14_0_20_39_15]|uniref:NAD-dependent epimerase/dehydratase domain-containing protein n=1 Tax=bacterium (Candidatus Gribaldobacteria) CG08_land_8_20_14_0_20_39_15 TaxID=2014273 RepID=A0A2M6XUF6_9BACT|nr:MAG: hypothetical protein COT20_01810 [bacterium (Candidatus Gribaldobacteria) CG08_land_8_20_14_0_20_39_15]